MQLFIFTKKTGKTLLKRITHMLATSPQINIRIRAVYFCVLTELMCTIEDIKQTLMRRLIWAFAVRVYHKRTFSQGCTSTELHQANITFGSCADSEGLDQTTRTESLDTVERFNGEQMLG